MQKNLPGQKFVVFAFNRLTNAPVTGDAANITANLQKDFGTAAATNDLNPTELQDGFYAFDALQAETNADALLLLPETTTADVQVITVPGIIYTVSAGSPDEIPQTSDHTSILNSIAGFLDTEIAAILEDTGTTIPALIAALNNISVADIFNESMAGYSIAQSAGKILKGISEGWVSAEGAVDDLTPTTTEFITDLTEAASSFYKDQPFVFISGALKGQSRIIQAYDGATKTLTFDEAFTIAPSNTDQFIILATHVHSLSAATTNMMAGGDIDGFSLEESLKLILATAVGVLTGATTNSITLEAADGSKIRITMPVDADGNRTGPAVLDATG